MPLPGNNLSTILILACAVSQAIFNGIRLIDRLRGQVTPKQNGDRNKRQLPQR
jgi:hypothetical protein